MHDELEDNYEKIIYSIYLTEVAIFQPETVCSFTYINNHE
jgi:hypothetical protein